MFIVRIQLCRSQNSKKTNDWVKRFKWRFQFSVQCVKILKTKKASALNRIICTKNIIFCESFFSVNVIKIAQWRINLKFSDFRSTVDEREPGLNWIRLWIVARVLKSFFFLLPNSMIYYKRKVVRVLKSRLLFHRGELWIIFWELNGMKGKNWKRFKKLTLRNFPHLAQKREVKEMKNTKAIKWNLLSTAKSFFFFISFFWCLRLERIAENREWLRRDGKLRDTNKCFWQYFISFPFKVGRVINIY